MKTKGLGYCESCGHHCVVQKYIIDERSHVLCTICKRMWNQYRDGTYRATHETTYKDTCLDCKDIKSIPKLECKKGKKFKLTTGVCAETLPVPIDKSCFRRR